MAWPPLQRVGKQEGNASLQPPVAATSSGERALGVLGLHGRLVHLSRDFSRHILLSRFVVCEGYDSLPQQPTVLPGPCDSA